MPTKPCDVCGRPVDVGSLHSQPSPAFKDAVFAGFVPDQTTVEALARSLGVSLALALAVWKHGLVRTSERAWSLCRTCTERLTPFLGKAIRARGSSVDHAKQVVAAALPSPSTPTCIVFDIVTDVRIGSLCGEGPSAEEASADVRQRIPADAFGITEPKPVGGGRQVTFTHEAHSEDEARRTWNQHLSAGVRLDSLTCQARPKPGFLGIGRSPGTWSVTYTTPLEVEVNYKLPAEVRGVRIPMTESHLAQVRQSHSQLTSELAEVTKRADEDRRQFEWESKREDFLVRMMTQSLLSGLAARESLAVAPMNWPECVDRELDLIQQQISASTE